MNTTVEAVSLDLATRIARMPHAMRVAEFAQLIGIGRTCAYQMVEHSELPYYRLPGGSIRLDPAKVAQWLRTCEVAGPTPSSAHELPKAA